ncbi:MAG: hypothetical protein RIQ94_2911 [Pseudomonadota bacterium]
MSDISTIYDAIITKVDALFSGKLRIHNPYELSDNPELITKDSWGLKVETCDIEDMEFCKLTTTRQFAILFIRQFATIGNKEDAFDAVSKLILEDQQTLLNNLYSPTELDQNSIIDKIDIVNISGIEFTQSNQKKYLFCEIGFKITNSTAII